MPINYKRYPKNWKTEILPAILERSKGCCENCGRVHLSHVWSYEKKKHSMGKIRYLREWTFTPKQPHFSKEKFITVILTVAHLDHDATNHQIKLERLKHLCQLCHTRHDAKMKALKRICGRFCSWPNCYGPDCYDLPDIAAAET